MDFALYFSLPTTSNQTSEFAHSQREEVQRKGLGRKSGGKIQNRGFMGLE